MSKALRSTAATNGASGAKPPASRSAALKLGLTRAGSTESTELASSAPVKAYQLPKAAPKGSQLKKQALGDRARPISRLDILLAPRRKQPVYKPQGDTRASQEFNKAIKSTSIWTDVQQTVAQAEGMTASNIAFALYRLGCLYSFSSKFRKEGMRASGIVTKLVGAAQQKLHQMDAGSIVLLLDGCARLEHRPADKLLTALANSVYNFASSLEATQLPLVLWAFDRLKYIPRNSILAALDTAADGIIPAMSTQGLTLTLHGFQAAGYRPSARTLTRSADAMQRQLSAFKPSEVAACISAFAAFEADLPAALIMGIGRQNGQSVHSNIVTGKPSLSRQASSKSDAEVDSLAETRMRIMDQSAKAPANPFSAAGRIFRQVTEKVGDLDVGLPAQTTQAYPSHTFHHNI